MYLATLVPRNLPLSTYFIAIHDVVGVGGASQKPTNKKATQKKRGSKTSTRSIV